MPASYRGTPDFAELLVNQFISRTNLMARLSDPRRNLAHECGYPEVEPDAAGYQDLYERSEIAARVVQSLPRECWALPPCIYEDEDADVVTPFEQSWDGLGRQLRGQFGWHKEEAGSAIWGILRRADEESRIGRYGGILYGIDDGLPLDVPAAFMPGPTATRKLLYLRTFSEVNATVETWDDDEQSPRFGQPLTYTLRLADPRTGQYAGSMASRTQRVHWTRFLHVPADDDVSAMRLVLRRLLDLEKLYAGSAEMYWQGALPGWQFKANPKLDPSQVDFDPQQLKDGWEEYVNSMQRVFGVIGGELASLAPQVVDPRPQINAQLQAISVALQMPQRKLMGSERGELSSTQDEDDWGVIIRGRKAGHCTSRLAVPFVDRCIALGLLPVPASGEYYCWSALPVRPEVHRGRRWIGSPLAGKRRCAPCKNARRRKTRAPGPLAEG